MADFCKQCTEELFDDLCGNDFAGLTTPEDTVQGLYAVVLCEGCGPCQVDHTGFRVTPKEESNKL